MLIFIIVFYLINMLIALTFSRWAETDCLTVRSKFILCFLIFAPVGNTLLLIVIALACLYQYSKVYIPIVLDFILNNDKENCNDR